MYLAFYTREHSCVPQSGAQMCSQDVSERMLGTFLSTENVFSVEERSDIGGGGFVALLPEIGRKTARGTNREETGWVCSHEKRRITRPKTVRCRVILR